MILSVKSAHAKMENQMSPRASVSSFKKYDHTKDSSPLYRLIFLNKIIPQEGGCRKPINK